MKPRTLLQGLAGLAAWGCLSGLALVRLWAVLYGRVPGPAILAAAAALAALVVGAAWRLRLVPRLLLPFGPTWRTALLAGAAFFLGALLDTSYGLFSAGDMAIGRLPFRLVCALGSGLVLAGVVLALATAARRFGRLELPRGRALLLLALAVNVLTALYAAGSATVYYWDSNIYWSSSTMLAGQSLDLAQVRLVLQSVITQEYNYLLSWPISLVMRVLGTGRYVYLFAIANLYVLPALAGMAALARRVRRGGVRLACATPLLLYTALSRPAASSPGPCSPWCSCCGGTSSSLPCPSGWHPWPPWRCAAVSGSPLPPWPPPAWCAPCSSGRASWLNRYCAPTTLTPTRPTTRAGGWTR